MPVLERWTPIGDLDLMNRRMRRVFEDVGLLGALTPAADIYETRDAFVVELEVPGFDESDLDIEIVGRTLVVRGERTASIDEREAAVLVRERLETTFERRFDLPYSADGDDVTATYAEGVLTLAIPKRAESKSHKVEIGR